MLRVHDKVRLGHDNLSGVWALWIWVLVLGHDRHGIVIVRYLV